MDHANPRQERQQSSFAHDLGKFVGHSLDATLSLFFTAYETSGSSLTPATINQAIAREPEFYQKLDQILDQIHQDFLDPQFISAVQFKKNQQHYFIQHFNDINHQNDTRATAPDFKKAFETVLTQYLQHKSLLTTSMNTVETKENIGTQSKITNSLAYLWKQLDKKNPSDDLTIFLNEMSDAHGLIQVTGWSTQNENSLLAFFDYYNYMKYRKAAAEGRSIVLGLITPLYPLFTEYQDIAHREKSIVLKVLRTALPMLITACFIISVAACIPVVIPELAFFFIIPPLLYLGLVTASLYVKTKELGYQSYRHAMYRGDLDKMPEFQINSRLKTIFGAEMAKKIRDEYVEAIKTCDKVEHKYLKQEVLTSNDEKKRETNLDERNARILEWFDLRDNTKLNVDQIYHIALERSNQQFKTAQTEDKLKIKSLASGMANDLHAALSVDVHHNNHVAIDTQPKLRFFPSCLKQRDKIIELQTLEATRSCNYA